MGNIIENELNSIKEILTVQNQSYLNENIIIATDSDETKVIISKNKIAKYYLCKDEKCIKGIQDLIKKGEVVGYENSSRKETGNCIFCKKPTAFQAFHGRRV